MMSTPKQKIIAKNILENLGSKNPKTLGEIVLESGYKESMAKNPYQITESKGVKKELDDKLKEWGITKDDRLKVLSGIFYSDDKRSQIEANKEITKMLGEYAPNQISITNAFQSRDEVVE